MAIDTSVKNYRSTDTGAPQLPGQAGSLIAVLDSLVVGYNLLTATSVVVANGVATATYATAHGYRKNAVLLYAGAGNAAINGEKRALSVTTYTLTFDAAGVADGAVPGTITSKMAPAGFAKVFVGANKVAYQSTDLAGTSRSLLRIDDTAGAYARAISYESMTDIDTGSGPMPTTAQLSGGGYICKSTTSDAVARKWYLIADGRFFYLQIHRGDSPKIYFWGEFQSLRQGDAYNTILGLMPAAAFSNYSQSVETVAAASSSNYGASAHGAISLQRGADQMIQSVPTAMASLISSTNNYAISGGSSTSWGMPAYPADSGGFDLSPVFVKSNYTAANPHKRGRMPGLYHCMTQMSAFSEQERDDIPSMPGRVLLVLPTYSNVANDTGYVCVDLIGPWR